MIDITMTATLRPEILEETLSSFKRNLFRDLKVRLIMNIDPVGKKTDPMCIVDKAREYFDDIIFRASDVAHFGSAFVWCWSQVTAPFTFHLEDDWRLLRPIDLEDMILLMKLNNNLAVLRLPAWKIEEQSKNWSHFYPWNGQFFECPIHRRAELGFCGHPSLINSEFVRNTVIHLNPALNPEKQFHKNKDIVDETLKWRFGVYGQKRTPAAIEDIGRRWMVEQGIRKFGNKAYFTTWEEAADSP